MKYLIMLAMLAACSERPQSIKQTSNPSIEVGLLFEHEECKVYRFKDNNDYVYYTNCRGSTQYKVSCGENCTRTVTVD